MAYAVGDIAVAICDRCSFRYPYKALRPDLNSPGLRVCTKCRDQLDPYRLPARQPEPINLRFARPDVPLYGSISAVPDNALVTQTNEPFVTETGDYIVVS